jgi:hypothetical protein
MIDPIFKDLFILHDYVEIEIAIIIKVYFWNSISFFVFILPKSHPFVQHPSKFGSQE